MSSPQDEIFMSCQQQLLKKQRRIGLHKLGHRPGRALENLLHCVRDALGIAQPSDHIQHHHDINELFLDTPPDHGPAGGNKEIMVLLNIRQMGGTQILHKETRSNECVRQAKRRDHLFDFPVRHHWIFFNPHE